MDRKVRRIETVEGKRRGKKFEGRDEKVREDENGEEIDEKRGKDSCIDRDRKTGKEKGRTNEGREALRLGRGRERKMMLE